MYADTLYFESAAFDDFCISMFTEIHKAMKRSEIEKRLKALTGLFPADCFLAAYEASKDRCKCRLLKKA